MDFLGIDIGCSSIKYGLVHAGEQIEVRDFDIITMALSAGAEKYCDALSYIFQNSASFGAVGVGFPSRIWANKILRTSIDFNAIWEWARKQAGDLGVACAAVNDADAAGIAEVSRPEAGELRQGVSIMLTLGSGIGSAVFLDGKLLPNTELGNLEMYGIKAEQFTAASVMVSESLSIETWVARLQEYLDRVEYILSPHHLVLGGGISAEFDQYQAMLKTRATLSPAYYRNQAGVIGAALYAASATRYYNQPL